MRSPDDDPELSVALLLETLRAWRGDRHPRRRSWHRGAWRRSGGPPCGLTLGARGGSGDSRRDASARLCRSPTGGRGPGLEGRGAARIAFDRDRGHRGEQPGCGAATATVYAIRATSLWQVRRFHPLGEATAAGLVVRSILFRFGGKARPEPPPVGDVHRAGKLAHVGFERGGGAPPLRQAQRTLRWPFWGERPRARGQCTRDPRAGRSSSPHAPWPRSSARMSSAHGGGRAHRAARPGRGRSGSNVKSPGDRNLPLSDAARRRAASAPCRLYARKARSARWLPRRLVRLHAQAGLNAFASCTVLHAARARAWTSSSANRAISRRGRLGDGIRHAASIRSPVLVLEARRGPPAPACRSASPTSCSS